MAKSKSENEAVESTLDDLVIALQKSFSRVSYRSQQRVQEAPDSAVSIVVGPINFSITVRLRPNGDDRLIYDSEHGFEASFSGKIDPDIRFEELQEE